MADEIDRNDASEEAPKPKKDWWVVFIDYCKRQLQEYRAKKEKRDPSEHAATSTARASWVMATFTVVIAVVGVLQWAVIRSQLEEMRKQSDISEAMLDNPVWLSGIKSFHFADPAFDGHASVDVVLKNAGKQLGIIELLIVTIETRDRLDLPSPAVVIPPHDAGCIDFLLGEVTLLAGDEKTLHMMCFPTLKPGNIAATLAAKRFTILRVFLAYYDRRRIAHERSTIFLYRRPTSTAKDAQGSFESLGSKEMEVPESETAKLEALQRRSNADALQLQVDIDKQLKKK